MIKNSAYFKVKVSILRSHFNFEVKARFWGQISSLRSYFEFEVKFNFRGTISFRDQTALIRLKVDSEPKFKLSVDFLKSIWGQNFFYEVKIGFWVRISMIKSKFEFVAKIRSRGQILISRSNFDLEVKIWFQT